MYLCIKCTIVLNHSKHVPCQQMEPSDRPHCPKICTCASSAQLYLTIQNMFRVSKRSHLTDRIVQKYVPVRQVHNCVVLQRKYNFKIQACKYKGISKIRAPLQLRDENDIITVPS